MVFEHRSLAFIALLVMLFSGVVSGQEVQGMAIIANNPTALGVTIPVPVIGPVPVTTGHVAFAYQNPLTGKFVFGSVGMDPSKATNLIDPTELDINKEYTFDELKTLLAKEGYTSYKAFYTDDPNFNAATKAETDLTTANYNLFASTTKPITDPFSHAVGADDENCLTGTKKVLEAYGVDLPDWDEAILDTVSAASLPNVWYLSLQGDTYYPDFMGDDPSVPTGYKKSDSPLSSGDQKTTPSAALAAFEIGFPMLSPNSDTFGFSGPNAESTDVPETTGVSYFDQANDVWYIDAFSWRGDRSLYDRPAAPMHFVSGELNTFGYNWVYLPYSRTGIPYDQGYLDWVTEVLASMGQSAPSAGYGLLVSEDSEF